jgi:hypothetical protein
MSINFCRQKLAIWANVIDFLSTIEHMANILERAYSQKTLDFTEYNIYLQVL